MDPRKPIHDLLRPHLHSGWNTPNLLKEFNEALDDLGARKEGNSITSSGSKLTLRCVLELFSHEAIVQEAYKDTEGIWTWAVGVTSRSGHKVEGYKDNPQSLQKCIEVSIWLMENKYLPDVLKAFDGYKLSEHELAAALSFHYNTGAVLRTDWVKFVKDGKRRAAREFLENHYLNGGDLKSRRMKEALLFFDGHWDNDGKTTVYEVNKPSYAPKWSSAKRVDISKEVKSILGI